MPVGNDLAFNAITVGSNIYLFYLPDLTYAWVFNEYPYFVQQDNRRFVSQQTGNLYISKVEPSDVGNYTCVVMNSITKGKVHSSPTSLNLRTDGKTHDVTSVPFSLLYGLVL